MFDKRKRIFLGIIGACAFIAAIVGLIYKVMPTIDVGLPYIGFVDRLLGKPYSNSDYDGIDVSKHQGVIKWDEVAQNKKIKFVYIRATMGRGHKDKRYERNISGAKEAGLKVGSYHFLTSKSSIDEQFHDFLAAAKPSEQDLIPMVDVENGYFDGWNKAQLQDSLARLSSLVKEYYGRKPMIYSNVSFYNRNLAPRFNDHIIYIANYSSYMPSIRGDYNHNIWQYSEHGHIRGIGEYVDLCRFTNGTTVDDIMIKKD